MKLVIVGGVAGGASCAARARRLSEEAEIVILERGDHVSFANCGLPYYIGGFITERNRLLVQTAEGLRRRFKIDVRTRSEVTAIDRKAKEVSVRTRDGKEYREPYDKLVLAPGAAPVRPPLAGIDHPRILTLRNLDDADAIKAACDAGARRALVVGAGYIGLEMAECFRHRGMDVTVVELTDQVMPIFDPEMAELILKELETGGVEVILSNAVKSFTGSERSVTAVLTDGSRIEADVVVVGVGVRPEALLAREAGLEIGPTGGIKVDQRMRTSDGDIYAVGDAVEVTDFVTGQACLVPLAGPANRQGRNAADDIFGRKVAYGGTQGTAVVRVFGLTAAMTGASEKRLKTAGLPYEKIYIQAASHARYYPGAETMALKLLFAPGKPGHKGAGKVLGAQAIGGEGVDKRIDVLATAIRAGLTVFDLEELELSYAPPYGSAKDPVNVAGFVASNVLRGDMPVVWPERLVEGADPDALVLDVRSREEYDEGHVENAYLVPLDDLRDRLDELPKNRPIHAYCKSGLRSYLATRILRQNGFDARNVTGAWDAIRVAKSVGARAAEGR